MERITPGEAGGTAPFDGGRLWQERRKRFWRQVIPYIGYVAQSGLAIVLVLGFITGTAFYANYLDHIPPGFPVRELVLLMVAPATAYMTYRTFLEPPDLVFLLRVEGRMADYMKRSIRYSLIPRMLLPLAVWTVLWPLYHRADQQPKHFALMLAVIILLKSVAAAGSWGERQMSDPSLRRAGQWLRYAWVWGSMASWLWLSVPAAALITGTAGLGYIGWTLTRSRLRFPWERHIETERVHTSRVFLFLSNFVDIAVTEERRYMRPWLKRFGDRHAYRPHAAYRYLLAKTFARSELLGILMRLTVIGLLALLWVRDSVWSAAAYGLLLLVIGAQLHTLFTYHRHDVMRSIYPLPPHARHEAALRMSTAIHLSCAIVLLIPLWLGATAWSFKGAAAAGGLALVLLFRLKRAKRRADDDEA
ncbi:ABC transporter permease [Paenibacillus thiaminolyticus]|uniref:ABC transporter permease n=1 Tax=Paenibacillus thiaminolyticus TaxID=49283 RepID=UPI002543DAEC|nr:ABC transporter permease [Paenibacillus thiaminolyticus]WII38846.1 ABC transporter permease [Paenibacillus thiaminolyticus]